MKALCSWVIWAAYAVAFAIGGANAASTMDFTDQWWNPAEPGWGVSVHQQGGTLFLNLMVYGSDGNPIWLTASAFHQGGHAFVGDLYATTGTHYDDPFDASTVNVRKVGTLTFHGGLDKATISYTADGTPFVKNVVRQTWVGANLDGTYDTIWKSNCNGVPSHPWGGSDDWEFSETVIRHYPNNTVTMKVTRPFYWDFEFERNLWGRFSQSGRLGQIIADVVSPNSGSITIEEIDKTTAGFTGRFTGTLGGCRIVDGRLVALLRAP